MYACILRLLWRTRGVGGSVSALTIRWPHTSALTPLARVNPTSVSSSQAPCLLRADARRNCGGNPCSSATLLLSSCDIANVQRAPAGRRVRAKEGSWMRWMRWMSCMSCMSCISRMTEKEGSGMSRMTAKEGSWISGGVGSVPGPEGRGAETCVLTGGRSDCKQKREHTGWLHASYSLHLGIREA